MSNSIFVPLLRMPSGIEEVSSIINSVFAEFNLPPPRVWLDNKGSLSNSLTNGFVMVEGLGPSNQCWVSVSKCAPELTGDEECSVLADVKTRGSWLFAGIGQESYSAESLKEVIRKLI
jgi:hypothetical protein